MEIGLQLYSVRDALAADYYGTLEAVAAAGYRTVELAGAYGTSPAETARRLSALGVRAPAAHVGLPLSSETLDLAAAFGCTHLICPWMPPETFRTRSDIARNCDLLNEAAQVAKRNGLALLYHNHWWEYREVVDEQPVYRLMASHLEPEVGYEVDLYWAKTGGADPRLVMAELGGRVQIIHIKDGPLDENQPMTAIGEGAFGWDALIGELRASALAYGFVEMDRVGEADTPVAAATRSMAWLRAHGAG
jgi:sugar phosphate isomerase/epimerase